MPDSTPAAAVDVYIDVDGVINAVCLSVPRTWGWTRFERYQSKSGFTISYSPDLVERLNRLASLPHVAMHWLTTWEHDAAKELAPAIGLHGGEWPVLGTEKHYSKELAGGWWKHAALVDYFPPRGRRAVWIDDDIAFDQPACDWVAQLGGRLLIVSPSTERGITRDEMDRIDEFVGGVA